ncbi:MAG: hypothetical protein U9Q85_03960 [Patescibacteria group bacterium]|nr:hypothetical protein [Patescibacteria group bacterium]
MLMTHEEVMWEDADVISSTSPPSKPFVDYFLNNGEEGETNEEDVKGPDFFGIPTSAVQQYDLSGLWTQDYQNDYLFILNPHIYNVKYYYMGVVNSVHGKMRDYWEWNYMDLKAPVTPEYYYPAGTDDYVVQWFEPTDNYYIAVVYDNREGIGGTYAEYEQGDAGCPPYDQNYFDQPRVNSGYKSDGYGMGGGYEAPPEPDDPSSGVNYTVDRA